MNYQWVSPRPGNVICFYFLPKKFGVSIIIISLFSESFFIIFWKLGFIFSFLEKLIPNEKLFETNKKNLDSTVYLKRLKSSQSKKMESRFEKMQNFVCQCSDLTAYIVISCYMYSIYSIGYTVWAIFIIQ